MKKEDEEVGTINLEIHNRSLEDQQKEDAKEDEEIHEICKE